MMAAASVKQQEDGFYSMKSTGDWHIVYNQTTGSVQDYHHKDYTKPYNVVAD